MKSQAGARLTCANSSLFHSDQTAPDGATERA